MAMGKYFVDGVRRRMWVAPSGLSMHVPVFNPGRAADRRPWAVLFRPFRALEKYRGYSVPGGGSGGGAPWRSCSWSRLFRVNVFVFMSIAFAGVAATAVEPIQEPAPLSVGIDSVEINLRVEPAGTDPRSATAPALVRPDYGLTLAVPLPIEASLLTVHDVRLMPALSDAGERIGLLFKAPNRRQTFGADSQANRDRVLRLALNLTPPFSATAVLHHLRGWFTVDLGWGRPQEDEADATTGASFAGGRLTIAERDASTITVVYASDVFTGDGHLVFLDRDGHDLRGLPVGDPVPVGNRSRQVWRLRNGDCVKMRVEWFAHVSHETLDLDIRDLPIPGGLPGIGAMVQPPLRQRPRPMLPKPAQGALEQALDQNQPKVARPLILKVAKDADLGAALQIAVGKREHALVTLLLDHGAPLSGGPTANLESGPTIGCPPLLIAANNGDPAMVELLLARGADPAVVCAAPGGGKGWTALHAAIAGGDAECVHALMGAGCDPERAATDGRNVYDLARDLERWRLLHDLLGNLP